MARDSDMDLNRRWWEDFFSGLINELPPMYSEERTRADADFLTQVLALQPGQRIADIPCGSGRIALELASRGFDVTGIDFTAHAIEQAKNTAQKRGLIATFQHGDMLSLSAAAEFDSAFCFGNSFPYFDDAGNADFLARIARLLKPGGRFALETGLAAESALPRPTGRRWHLLGDIYFLHETNYDPASGCWISNYTLMRGTQIERKQAVYPIYTYREFVRMFETAGFRDIMGYGSLQREPYRLGNEELWLVATRRA